MAYYLVATRYFIVYNFLFRKLLFIVSRQSLPEIYIFDHYIAIESKLVGLQLHFSNLVSLIMNRKYKFTASLIHLL